MDCVCEYSKYIQITRRKYSLHGVKRPQLHAFTKTTNRNKLFSFHLHVKDSSFNGLLSRWRSLFVFFIFAIVYALNTKSELSSVGILIGL